MPKHVLGKFAKACVRKHFSAASDSRSWRCFCECEDMSGWIDLSAWMPADDFLVQCLCTSCGPKVRGKKRCQVKILGSLATFFDGLCEDCRDSLPEGKLWQNIRVRMLTTHRSYAVCG